MRTERDGKYVFGYLFIFIYPVFIHLRIYLFILPNISFVILIPSDSVFPVKKIPVSILSV